jgi:hypothetical protein
MCVNVFYVNALVYLQGFFDLEMRFVFLPLLQNVTCAIRVQLNARRRRKILAVEIYLARECQIYSQKMPEIVIFHNILVRCENAPS